MSSSMYVISIDDIAHEVDIFDGTIIPVPNGLDAIIVSSELYQLLEVLVQEKLYKFNPYGKRTNMYDLLAETYPDNSLISRGPQVFKEIIKDDRIDAMLAIIEERVDEQPYAVRTYDMLQARIIDNMIMIANLGDYRVAEFHRIYGPAETAQNGANIYEYTVDLAKHINQFAGQCTEYDVEMHFALICNCCKGHVICGGPSYEDIERYAMDLYGELPITFYDNFLTPFGDQLYGIIYGRSGMADSEMFSVKFTYPDKLKITYLPNTQYHREVMGTRDDLISGGHVPDRYIQQYYTLLGQLN